jgi:hypothetical protein
VGVIDWVNIDAALLELFPNPPSIPGTYPGVAYLYASKADFSPWPESPDEGDVTCPSGVNLYDKAKVTITYATIKYDHSDLMARHRTFSVESMPLPNVNLRWKGDAKKVTLEHLNAYKNIPIVEHRITLFRATASSDAGVRSLAGMVNNASFEGATAETLLFTGCDESYTISTSGVKSYTKTFSFKERRIKQKSSIYGWNHAWRQEENEWQELETKDGDPVFELGNFSTLY